MSLLNVSDGGVNWRRILGLADWGGGGDVRRAVQCGGGLLYVSYA